MPIETEQSKLDQKAAPKAEDKQPAREGGGQRTSQERGSHTNNKKSAGKRPHQGG